MELSSYRSNNRIAKKREQYGFTPVQYLRVRGSRSASRQKIGRCRSHNSFPLSPLGGEGKGGVGARKKTTLVLRRARKRASKDEGCMEISP